MKTRKISAGCYEFNYKSQNVRIIKTEDSYSGGYVWYSVLNDNYEDVHDVSYSKKACIDSAVYMIDNPTEFEIDLV